MMKIFSPLARLLTWIGLLAAKLTRGEPEISVTEDELLDIFEDLAEEGVLEFTDTKTGRILTPKRKIVGIDVNLSKEEVFDLIEGLNHSRVVVYDGTIDNVLGILRIREYLKEYLNTHVLPDVRDIMDEPYYVSSRTMADELLEEMSKARQNIAPVKGVNGKFIGLVSIEDILEELVGDIFDESDEEGGLKK